MYFYVTLRLIFQNRVTLYKAEKPSVRLSVRHADNSPGTAYIDLSTAHYHKTIILLLQVCHRELMR